MRKLPIFVAAIAALALSAATVVPTTADAGWRRWAWRGPAPTVYVAPAPYYGPNYAPAYAPYPPAYPYAPGYRPYGPYASAYDDGYAYDPYWRRNAWRY